MKSIYTTVLIISLLNDAFSQEQEIEFKSKIQSVTVFQRGAQISRSGQMLLPAGNLTLHFPGLAPDIQESSIQVSGSSSLKVLSVSFVVDYMKETSKSDKVVALEAERLRLLTLVKKDKSMQTVYEEEERILLTNKSIGGTSKGVPIEDLKIAMQYFRERLTDIKNYQLQLEQHINEYQLELGKIESQLRELTGLQPKPTGEIIVKVSNPVTKSESIHLSYVVKNAQWFPSYDIRAKDIQSSISVTYKANISQHTGEDWNHVVLTVSSANPAEPGSSPIVKPWYIGFNNRYKQDEIAIVNSESKNSLGFVRGRVIDSEGKGVPGVNVVVKGSTVGTTTDIEGFYSLALNGGAETLAFSFIGYQSEERPIRGENEVNIVLTEDKATLSEVVVTGYGARAMKNLTGSVAGVSVNKNKTIAATPVIRQTHVEFQLKEPFTLKSDGGFQTTDMVEYELEASYEYYTAPMLSRDAFLTARILNWDEYNFMEGEANLFFEGKYIGKSLIESSNPSDTLNISLGRDANILIDRKRVKEFSSRQLIGSHQKTAAAYELVIRNKKSQPIKIVVKDQVPVPNTKEISVDQVDYGNAVMEDATGIVTWRREIDPGKIESMTLKYVVRYPKNQQLILE
jgi:hypothetical protein